MLNSLKITIFTTAVAGFTAVKTLADTYHSANAYIVLATNRSDIMWLMLMDLIKHKFMTMPILIELISNCMAIGLL